MTLMQYTYQIAHKRSEVCRRCGANNPIRRPLFKSFFIKLPFPSKTSLPNNIGRPLSFAT